MKWPNLWQFSIQLHVLGIVWAVVITTFFSKRQACIQFKVAPLKSTCSFWGALLASSAGSVAEPRPKSNIWNTVQQNLHWEWGTSRNYAPRLLRWWGYPDDGSWFSDRASSQESGDFVIQKLKQNVKLIMYNWLMTMSCTKFRITEHRSWAWTAFLCRHNSRKINWIETL